MARLAARVLPALAALTLFAGSTVRATTVLPLTFDEIVQGAREIFIGQVVTTQSRYVDTPDGRAIMTLVTFRIDDPLKGGLQAQTSLEFLGGTVGDATFVVTGAPQFRVGDRDVVFIGPRNDISPIVGFMQGRFRILRDPVRGVDTVRTHDGRTLSSLATIGKPVTPSAGPAVQAIALSEFRAAILSRLQPSGGGR